MGTPQEFQVRRVSLLYAFFIFILVIYLIQHISAMNINFHLQQLEVGIKELKYENERMQIALAKDTALENIDAQAVVKLGMIRPTKVEYLLISKLKR